MVLIGHPQLNSNMTTTPQKKTLSILAIGGKIRDSISIAAFIWGTAGTLIGYAFAPAVSKAIRPIETRVTAVESSTKSTLDRLLTDEVRIANLETEFKEFKVEQKKQSEILNRVDERTLLILKQR